MRRTPLAAAPIFALLVLSPAPATAQAGAPEEPDHGTDAPPSDPTDAPLLPPKLKHEVQVPYPEVEGEPTLATVLLAITIDETGRVLEPSLVEGAGEPFDSLALDLIQGFEFEPALQDGQAIAARIQYRLAFTPPVPAAVPAPEPALPAPPPSAPPAPAAAPGPAATDRADEEESFEAVAEVDAPQRETTRRSLEKEQLTRMPGTRGDALRAVEVLPGIGRTGFAESEGPPIIRGAYAYESLVVLDGAPIPLLYHFGGLTSVYNSHLLEQVELYPGNFSSRYGRAVGGVVEAQTRDPKTDRLHGMLELSLIDSFALVEGPISESTAVAFAARRSNIDMVFEQLVPEDAYNVVAAPVYYDYQAMLVHRFNDRHKLKLQAYGSYDSLKLVFADPNEEDPGLKGRVEGEVQYHKFHINWTGRLSSVVEQKLDIVAGPARLHQRIGDLDSGFTGLDLNGRAEWSIFASDSLRLDVGIDTFLQTLHGEYAGPPPPQEEGVPAANQPLGTYEVIRVEDTIYIFRPGAYAELSYRPISDWLLIPGVRADYDKGTGSWVIDPRFSTRYSLRDSTTLKAGVGLYSQPPEYYQLIPQFGNPDLTPYRALHVSSGVEHELMEGFELGVEGFYKYMLDRVVGTAGGAPPHFLNDGEGRIYGAELSLELKRSDHFGYLAYTLSKSERHDRDEDWRLFDHDQTHNLSAVYNYQFGSGWSAGARFRLSSGNPETPVLGGVYDANSDLYRAIYGDINSERMPMFHQLDVRGEKQWTFENWSLTAYLEVLNAYNAQNVQGQSYSFDYTQKETVTGLPIFPNLGIRGEL